MSLIRAVTTGSLIGVATAVGIFVAAGPDDLGRVAAPAAPTFAPVPTPTVTELADCEKPAVLKKGICVTTKPGPVVIVAPPVTGSTTSAPRSAPRTAPRTATAPAPAPEATDEDQEHHDDDGEHEDDGDEHDH